MDTIAGALLVAGLVFVLAGVIGVLRLPDFYARLHATSKCDTVGLSLMAAGVAIHTGFSLTTVKVLLLVYFVAVVNTTVAHALGRAAHRSGLVPWTTDTQGRHD
jgi:multicomponent Na+:H+ antiporter subunit G